MGRSFAAIGGFWYRTNGTAWVSAGLGVNWNIVLNTTTITNGELHFDIMSSNAAGLVSYDYITNYVSNSAPTVSITNPSIDSWLFVSY